jgi:hypothetical protein
MDHDTTSLGTRVVESVARASGNRPLELPPLHRAVDVDALVGLYAHADGDTAGTAPTVRFVYADHVVVVRSATEVDVRRLGADSDGSTGM